jgi:hypothetical protein
MRYTILGVLLLITGLTIGCATTDDSIVDVGEGTLVVSMNAKYTNGTPRYSITSDGLTVKTNFNVKAFRKTNEDGRSYLIKLDGNTITHQTEE